MTEPRVLTLHKAQLDPADYKLRSATEADYSTLITESTVIVDAATGKPSVVYLELDENLEYLFPLLEKVKYVVDARTNGMKSIAKVFGYQPRNTLRRDFCTNASLAQEHPTANRHVIALAELVSRYYQQYHPELFAKHMALAEKVLPEWRLAGTPFTSGIINQNNPLMYHFDRGNFVDVWSNMLVLKKDVAGGYLAVPEFGVGFELKNNSLLMFDGQNLLHGVTPIRKRTAQAYRYSIVYYSLKGLWNCLPPKDEVARIQKIRTERERKRLQRDRDKRNT